MRNRKWIEEQLIATGKWGKPTPALAERAGYRCEYCGFDLLASLENYKLWQVDHIIPVSKGGDLTEDNLALACRHCNCDFKGGWNPNPRRKSLTREQMIDIVKAHIAKRREAMERDLARVREIVGYRNGLAPDHPIGGVAQETRLTPSTDEHPSAPACSDAS